ncbi:MAG: J domain-containing protein [Bdellovibrionales bacterium]|nr:J domain-containing protein [Bdellovibrionales bacterium]
MKRFLLAIFVALLFIGRGATLLLAEVKNIHGLSFLVDEIIPIDESNIRVSLFGSEQILSPGKVDGFVASHYLNREDLFSRFDAEKVFSFVKTATDTGDLSLASLALYRYLENAEISSEEKLESLLELYELKNAVELFKEVLQREMNDELGLPGLFLCAIVGASDLKWLRLKKSPRIFSSEETFLSVVRTLVERQLVKPNGFAVVSSFLRLTEELFGSNHPKVQNLSLLVEKTKSLILLPVSIDRSSLYPFLNKKLPVTDSRIMRPLVVHKIHEFSSFAIEEKTPNSALVLLAELLPSERSEKTQQLIIDAMNIADPSSTEVKSSRVVQQMLLEESKNNIGVKQAYLSFLKRAFEAEMNAGRLRSAAQYREQLRQIDMQAQEEYDQMIFREAVEWARRGKRDSTSRLLQLRSRNSNFRELFQLYSAGFYGGSLTFILLLLIPILSISLILVRRREQRALLAAREEALQKGRVEIEPEGVFSDSPADRAAVTNLRAGGTGALLLEYKNLMATFDLPWQASVGEIKSAYRKRIKEVHPDVQGAGVEEASDDFIMLSRRYERILELRGRLDLFHDD